MTLLLAGCTTWVHPTKSRADFEMDTYLCAKETPTSPDPSQDYQMRRRCMMQKGWRPQ